MKAIKPLPYISRRASLYEKDSAHWYRHKLVPLIKRRLKTHHLAGFKADFIVNYVAEQKKKFPFFVRTDIRLFYPSIQHQTIHPNIVLGYKALLSAPIIPVQFERESRQRFAHFLQQLPIPYGLPLGHAMSGILAPAMLIPLWMRIKQQFNVPFIVYMDDVLFFARSESQAQYIYENLAFYLDQDYKLRFNPEKTVSGRFSNTSFSFCGWHFSGGYARICERKIAAFKERFVQRLKNTKGKALRAYIKTCNRLIDGFGNYYKYGNVSRQFDLLDKWLRRTLRASLKPSFEQLNTSNFGFKDLGLHSLSILYQKTKVNSCLRQNKLAPKTDAGWNASTIDKMRDLRYQATLVQSLEKLIQQQATLIGLAGKQLLELQKLSSY